MKEKVKFISITCIIVFASILAIDVIGGKETCRTDDISTIIFTVIYSITIGFLLGNIFNFILTILVGGVFTFVDNKFKSIIE